MKPFDLQKALAGESSYPLMGRIETEQIPTTWTNEGRMYLNEDIKSNFDLFMADTEIEKWTNIYEGPGDRYSTSTLLFDSKNDAIESAKKDSVEHLVIATIPVKFTKPC